MGRSRSPKAWRRVGLFIVALLLVPPLMAFLWARYAPIPSVPGCGNTVDDSGRTGGRYAGAAGELEAFIADGAIRVVGSLDERDVVNVQQALADAGALHIVEIRKAQGGEEFLVESCEVGWALMACGAGCRDFHAHRIYRLQDDGHRWRATREPL